MCFFMNFIVVVEVGLFVEVYLFVNRIGFFLFLFFIRIKGSIFFVIIGVIRGSFFYFDVIFVIEVCCGIVYIVIIIM